MEPTPLPTETPTESPTLTPWPSETASATATLDTSLTPTATASASATADASLTPTAAASASATLPSGYATPQGIPTEPPLTLMLHETFESGGWGQWQAGAGWSLTASEGGQAALTTGESGLRYPAPLGEAAASVRALLPAGGALRLSLRESAAGGYAAELTAEGGLTLWREGQMVAQTVAPPALPGAWRTLRLSALGMFLRVSVDGEEALTALEASPPPPGPLALSATAGALLDDVQVWVVAAAPLEALPMGAEGSAPESLLMSQSGSGSLAELPANIVYFPDGWAAWIGEETYTVTGSSDPLAPYGHWSNSGAPTMVTAPNDAWAVGALTQVVSHAHTGDADLRHALGNWNRGARVEGGGATRPLCGTTFAPAFQGPGYDPLALCQALGMSVGAGELFDTFLWYDGAIMGPGESRWPGGWWQWGQGSWEFELRYIYYGRRLQLKLTLAVDEDRLPSTHSGDPHTFTVGDEIPLKAMVSAEGFLSITEPVEITLTVPQALRPEGMTIAGEDPIRLSDIFATLICWVTGGANCGDLLNEILEILVGSDMVTYQYVLENGVTVGQSFPITLDVVGEVAGAFTVNGTAAVVSSAGQSAQAFSAMSTAASSESLAFQSGAESEVMTTMSSMSSFSASHSQLDVVVDPENPPTCPATVVTTDGSAGVIRVLPNGERSAESLASGAPVTVSGYHEGAGGWYYLGAGRWMSKSIIILADPNCERDLLRYDENGVAIPPPLPIPTDACVGLPVDGAQTNIRNLPSTSGSEVIATFTGRYWVRVLGRYTAGTPERYDDWYRIRLEREGDPIEGWAAASVTATTPLYGDLCTRLSVTDTAADPINWRAPNAAEILVMPTTYPAVMMPFYQAQSGETRLPTDEFRIPAPFPLLPSSDEMEVRLTQGYGLTEFAYLFPGTYGSTNQIHAGLDFFGVNEVTVDGCIDSNSVASRMCISVRAICDGVIVNTTGSAGPNSGGGITLRCDMPDGSPSNIVVRRFFWKELDGR